MSSQSDFMIVNGGVLKGYAGPGGDVTVPQGVYLIGKNAFDRCVNLRSITLPEGVIGIEYGAFRMCSSLQSVFLPEGLKSIEDYAFSCCSELQNVTFPKSLINIKYGAFDECISLQSITIPGRVKSIGGSAFSGCSSMKSINLEEGVASIREYAFRGCVGLRSVTLPQSITNIDSTAFKECAGLADENGMVIINGILFDCYNSTEEIIVPDGVTRIGFRAFDKCEKLRSITIPESVASIEEGAFTGCINLRDITLTKGLQKVGSYVFRDCSDLSVRIRDWTPAISKILKDCKFKTLYTEDISKVPATYRPAAALGFVLEKSTDLSTEQAEGYMTYFKRSAGKLAELAGEHIELLYFLLEHKFIKPKDVDAFMTAASKKGGPEAVAAMLNYQNEFGAEKIAKAREKKEKNVGQVFDRTLVRAQRTPDDGISGLTFVITGNLSKPSWQGTIRFQIWDSRKQVKEYLESYGAKLGTSISKSTDFLVTADPSSDSEKANKARELGVEVITVEEFNAMVGRRFKNEEQITVPSWVRTLGGHAFAFRSNLKSVTLPEGVIDIKAYAFYECTNLQNVTIPETVKSIEPCAFAECTNLRSITLPKGLTSIGYWAFHGCLNLTIHAPAGSYAEQYAEENSIPFVAE